MLSGSHRIESSTSNEGWPQKLWMLLLGDDTSPAASPYAFQREFHATTHKLVQVHRQVKRLQVRHNLETARLAQAYHDIPLAERAALPENLRQQLNRIESSHF
jgi:hypothetical protein